eukprot:TRINITY_DN1269_c0_g2_i7.p1 TRINITY_DN1269_c0_g2~~TRINITY_DN1269_c0_g2_i7.p1  ORF type:complete len:580 (-),score=160.71 TRINITY_DN1269_c0_g2_i7:7857-9596(-)
MKRSSIFVDDEAQLSGSDVGSDCDDEGSVGSLNDFIVDSQATEIMEDESFSHAALDNERLASLPALVPVASSSARRLQRVIDDSTDDEGLFFFFFSCIVFFEIYMIFVCFFFLFFFFFKIYMGLFFPWVCLFWTEEARPPPVILGHNHNPRGLDIGECLEGIIDDDVEEEEEKYGAELAALPRVVAPAVPRVLRVPRLFALPDYSGADYKDVTLPSSLAYFRHLSGLSYEELVVELDAMLADFGADTECKDMSNFLLLLKQRFPESLAVELVELDAIHNYYELRFFDIMKALAKSDTARFSQDRDVHKKSASLINVVKHMARTRLSMCLCSEARSRYFNSDFSVFDLVSFHEVEHAELNDFQKALFMFQNHCYENRLMRDCAGVMYQPVVRDGEFKFAYEPMSLTVKEFVASLAKQANISEKWTVFTANPSIIENVAKHMCLSDNFCLPIYRPNRYYFAARNGVYDVINDKFVPFNEMPEGVICCNYFDMHLDVWDQYRNPNLWHEDGVEPEDDIMRIPTPSIDKVFRAQWREPGPNVPTECHVPEADKVIRSFYALMGRNMYEVVSIHIYSWLDTSLV